MIASPRMFDLANISPHWEGYRIVELEELIILGITRLREQSQGMACLGFALISEFDYDGVMHSIDHIRAYPSMIAANEALIQRLEAHEQAILNRDAAWTLSDENVFPPNLLPATLNVMPGDFGNQFTGRRFKHTIPYNSIYVRMLRVDHDSGDLVDQLLAYDGLQDEIVDCLLELGKA